MDDKLLKNRSSVEKETQSESKEKSANLAQDLEVKQTVDTVAEGINVLSENAEEGGSFKEEDGKYKDKGGAIQKSSSGTATTSRVIALPPVEEMIKQTVEAIELELRTTESEMRSMLKDKKTSPHDLNNQIRKIRFLNSILSQLSRAAKLAEEFVVGLWKQYVKKSN